MATDSQVEVTVLSAKNLKEANSPYAVVWVDSDAKFSTKIDRNGSTSPAWNEKLVIPLLSDTESKTLHVEVLLADVATDGNPLIGSAELSLEEVADEMPLGVTATRTLRLEPQGTIDVEVIVRRSPVMSYTTPEGHTVSINVAADNNGWEGAGRYPYSAPVASRYAYSAPVASSPYSAPVGSFGAIVSNAQNVASSAIPFKGRYVYFDAPGKSAYDVANPVSDEVAKKMDG